MDAYQSNPPYVAPPPFSPPLDATQRLSEGIKSSFSAPDNGYERPQRAASVLSGMSMEDMEAAETLNSLHKGDSEFHSPRSQQGPPTHVQTRSTYNAEETEPLLSLVTTQYPLAASLINGSISAYKTVQSYTPGGEWTERNIGLPLARKTARISGVESGLRWALQSKREQDGHPSGSPIPDVEKGYRESGLVLSESLPAYDEGDRSPPYYEQQVVLSRERQPPQGWRQQLVITTSGLGVAMSEESLRSLHYCLSWLRWANGKLDGAVLNLKGLLQSWDQSQDSPMSVASLTQNEADGRQAALLAQISALKAEVLQTLKQVVNIVSTYAGGALPENARNLVHQHLTSLPQRFSLASSRANSHSENGNEAASNANRVLLLAQEGLDMMNQVSRVVNDTLVSAEDWCEKLGRRRRQPQQQLLSGPEKESDDRERSMTSAVSASDPDVKMEM